MHNTLHIAILGLPNLYVDRYFLELPARNQRRGKC